MFDQKTNMPTLTEHKSKMVWARAKSAVKVKRNGIFGNLFHQTINIKMKYNNNITRM